MALYAMWTFQMEQEQRRMVDKKTGSLFQMEQMTPATMMRTGRELAAEGMTQRDIADVFGITKRTVQRVTNVTPTEDNSAYVEPNGVTNVTPTEQDSDDDEWTESRGAP